MLRQSKSTTPCMLGLYTTPPTNLISRVCFCNRNHPPPCMLVSFTKPQPIWNVGFAFEIAIEFLSFSIKNTFIVKFQTLGPMSTYIFKNIFMINFEYLDRWLLYQLSKTRVKILISVNLVSLHLFHTKKTIAVERLLVEFLLSSSF